MPLKDNDIKREGVGEIQDFWTIDTPDDELVKMIDRKMQTASGDYDEFKNEGKRNERYWMPNHLYGQDLYWYQSRIIQNRIYMGVETMVPIITSKPAEPVISVADDEEEESEKSRDFTGRLQKVLLDKYYNEDRPQQEIFEMITRHLLLFKLGALKIIWDKQLDDYYIEFIHPHKLIISPDGYFNEDVWVAQWIEKPLKELLEMFPDKEHDILANIFPGTRPTEAMMGTPIGFWEFWPEDGKFVVWKMRNVILQKKLNPYIKWADDKEFDKVKNHFDYCKKPYMFLNSQNLGKHIWDDTSVVSQGISLQDGINKMQRIITDTANDQGILVGAQESIDRDELYKYTGAPNQKLSIKGNDPSKALYRVPPKDLKQFVTENQLHLENALDNIMGTHSTTRGERSQQPTLGQDQMSKEADFGRIDGTVRGLERIASELYNWEMQMMAVKYKEKHYAKVLGEKNGKKLYEEIGESVKKGIKILVKSGSTLPTDKVSQRSEAVELAKANKIDDITFFERMDFPNPREAAKRLFMQIKYPEKLFPDLMKELEKDAKKKFDEGKGDGTIPPPADAPLPPVVAPGSMPDKPLFTAQGAPPVTESIPPVEPQVPPQPQQIGTEHTQRLLAGEPVPPFDGIEPSAEHVSQELQFIASEEFMQLPEEIQTIYAKHTIEEKDIIEQQTGSQVSL